RFEFMGKWLKHGDIYNSLIRMVRIGRASYINTGGCREKLMVQGRVLTLDSYIVHDDRKTIIDWYMKQGDRILLDAQERLENGKRAKNVSAPSASSSCTIEGSRSVTLRNRFLLRLPGPVRPFAQFFYRYILRLGFLDGWPGFVYHFLLQFWYPLMVEALYHQLKRKQHSNE
ncbi:MAG: hypothetical protein OEU95_04925, partial [Nitrospirota bacterium]|nr:hypothetical protein [Nitrospirota bacterium]